MPDEYISANVLANRVKIILRKIGPMYGIDSLTRSAVNAI